VEITNAKGENMDKRTQQKNKSISINLEIGENSEMMFHLPRDQAEPCNLNFEVQMHQWLSNKQPELEVTFPVMFGAINESQKFLINHLRYKVCGRLSINISAC
jgi:hypothetical protein